LHEQQGRLDTWIICTPFYMTHDQPVAQIGRDVKLAELSNNGLE